MAAAADSVGLTADLAFFSLAGTSALTLLGAVDTSNSKEKRQALTLETVVNVTAAVVYSYLRLALADQAEVTRLRYTDWLITTPLLLGSLYLFLSQNRPAQDNLGGLFWLTVGLNVGMLLFGWLGTKGTVTDALRRGAGLGDTSPQLLAWMCFAGVAALFGAFYYEEPMTWILFGVWALYGLCYNASPDLQNICYNLLDVVSKVGFGIFLYFSMQ